MRTTGFTSNRSSWPRRAPKPARHRWVAIGEKEHYDTTSPQDYREYLAVQRLSCR